MAQYARCFGRSEPFVVESIGTLVSCCAMPRRRHPSDAPHIVPHGLAYFEYQRLRLPEVVIPWLDARLDLAATRRRRLRRSPRRDARRTARVGPSSRAAVGLELSEEVVASSPFVGDDRFRLEVADVMLARSRTRRRSTSCSCTTSSSTFPTTRARVGADAARRFAPAGTSSSRSRPTTRGSAATSSTRVGLVAERAVRPLLPGRVFFRVARPGEKEYMTAEGSLEDMVSVRRTKLTLGRAERAFARAGLEVVDRELFLMRPEYTVRYGLKRARRRDRSAGSHPPRDRRERRFYLHGGRSRAQKGGDAGDAGGAAAPRSRRSRLRLACAGRRERYLRYEHAIEAHARPTSAGATSRLLRDRELDQALRRCRASARPG